MKVLSRRDIERLSRNILRQYINLPENRGKHFKQIDPVEFARQMYGIDFEFRYLSRHGSILGITSYGDVGVEVWNCDWEPELFFLDSSTALIDCSLQDMRQIGRRNFTMMHEVAHLIFKMLFPQDYGVKHRTTPLRYHLATEQTNGRITNWEEWQADALASFLLLPRELVLRTMIGAGFSSGIRLLNRKFAQQEYVRFKGMSEQLGVSNQALAIRMKQMGLIEREYLKNPDDLVNIYVEDQEWQRLQM